MGGGTEFWKRTRIPVVIVLLSAAFFLTGWAFRGRSQVPPFGGRGSVGFTASDYDKSTKKAIVFVRDDNTGYAFEIRLDDLYAHYTYRSKIFTGGCQSAAEIREVMDKARWWSDHDPEEGRFRGRDQDLRSYLPDPTVEDEKRAVAAERLQLKAQLEELDELREWRDRVLTLNPGLRQR
jgi:hypothetical protein